MKLIHLFIRFWVKKNLIRYRAIQGKNKLNLTDLSAIDLTEKKVRKSISVHFEQAVFVFSVVSSLSVTHSSTLFVVAINEKKMIIWLSPF